MTINRYKVERRGNSLVIFDTEQCKTLTDPKYWFSMIGNVDARKRADAVAKHLNENQPSSISQNESMKSIKYNQCPKCKNTGKTIYEFFDTHEGGDILLIRNLAMKRFGISENEFNYWLGDWRFLKCPQ